ncbi:MAG TPA: hypothetical protein VGR38_06430 [Candidatus Polarisedimenticolia bacterium]|nr:hypothetical protein [Candidatus Polarisedimenticolia bacterium]
MSYTATNVFGEETTGMATVFVPLRGMARSTNCSDRVKPKPKD